ncbi:MAG TPA: Bax inhibitor-1/YccA family protein [Dongiaceae bacterium]|nr:Bax inhibitor-1/YccA family protein [Dongiaceae bacterium]
MPNIFRSSNPVLRESTFANQMATGNSMTVQGTVNKTGLLLLCVVATAAWTWGLAHSDQPEAALPWMVGGIVGGLVTCLVTVFKKEWSGLTAPLYALFEGLILGGISAFFERQYHGIAVQAIALTFGVLFVLLFAYKTGLVRATKGFTLGILCATGAIGLVYAANLIMRLFGLGGMSFLYSSTPLGIGISVVVVIIAALNLILDFDMIERGAAMGAPKYMEWYGAFALMVTLIWLYMEILRLLGKARRR